jgi:hypothetical protein
VNDFSEGMPLPEERNWLERLKDILKGRFRKRGRGDYKGEEDETVAFLVEAFAGAKVFEDNPEKYRKFVERYGGSFPSQLFIKNGINGVIYQIGPEAMIPLADVTFKCTELRNGEVRVTDENLANAVKYFFHAVWPQIDYYRNCPVDFASGREGIDEVKVWNRRRAKDLSPEYRFSPRVKPSRVPFFMISRDISVGREGDIEPPPPVEGFDIDGVFKDFARITHENFQLLQVGRGKE